MSMLDMDLVPNLPQQDLPQHCLHNGPHVLPTDPHIQISRISCAKSQIGRPMDLQRSHGLIERSKRMTTVTTLMTHHQMPELRCQSMGLATRHIAGGTLMTQEDRKQ